MNKNRGILFALLLVLLFGLALWRINRNVVSLARDVRHYIATTRDTVYVPGSQPVRKVRR